MTAELVVARDVKKSFEHLGRQLDVLRGIDLTIMEGEMVGIVGESGAGKSTMLHCMGIDHTRLTYKSQGLDQKLTGVEPSKVLKEILA